MRTKANPKWEMPIFTEYPKVLTEPVEIDSKAYQTKEPPRDQPMVVPYDASDSKAERSKQEMNIKMGRNNNTLESDESETKSTSEKRSQLDKKCSNGNKKLNESYESQQSINGTLQ
jgi:hypothetical protein